MFTSLYAEVIPDSPTSISSGSIDACPSPNGAQILVHNNTVEGELISSMISDCMISDRSSDEE